MNNNNNQFKELQSMTSSSPVSTVSSNRTSPRSTSPESDPPRTEDTKFAKLFEDSRNAIRARILAGTPGPDFVSTYEAYEQLASATSSFQDTLRGNVLKPWKKKIIAVYEVDLFKANRSARKTSAHNLQQTVEQEHRKVVRDRVVEILQVDPSQTQLAEALADYDEGLQRNQVRYIELAFGALQDHLSDYEKQLLLDRQSVVKTDPVVEPVVSVTQPSNPPVPEPSATESLSVATDKEVSSESSSSPVLTAAVPLNKGQRKKTRQKDRLAERRVIAENSKEALDAFPAPALATSTAVESAKTKLSDGLEEQVKRAPAAAPSRTETKNNLSAPKAKQSSSTVLKPQKNGVSKSNDFPPLTSSKSTLPDSKGPMTKSDTPKTTSSHPSSALDPQAPPAEVEVSLTTGNVTSKASMQKKGDAKSQNPTKPVEPSKLSSAAPEKPPPAPGEPKTKPIAPAPIVTHPSKSASNYPTMKSPVEGMTDMRDRDSKKSDAKSQIAKPVAPVEGASSAPSAAIKPTETERQAAAVKARQEAKRNPKPESNKIDNRVPIASNSAAPTPHHAQPSAIAVANKDADQLPSLDFSQLANSKSAGVPTQIGHIEKMRDNINNHLDNMPLRSAQDSQFAFMATRTTRSSTQTTRGASSAPPPTSPIASSIAGGFMNPLLNSISKRISRFSSPAPGASREIGGAIINTMHSDVTLRETSSTESSDKSEETASSTSTASTPSTPPSSPSNTPPASIVTTQRTSHLSRVLNQQVSGSTPIDASAGASSAQPDPSLLTTFMQGQFSPQINFANPLQSIRRLPAIPVSLFSLSGRNTSPPRGVTFGIVPSAVSIFGQSSSSTKQSAITQSQRDIQQQISDDEDIALQLSSQQFDAALDQTPSDPPSTAPVEPTRAPLSDESTRDMIINELLQRIDDQMKKIEIQKSEYDLLKWRIDHDPDRSPNPYAALDDTYDAGKDRKGKPPSKPSNDGRRRSRLNSLSPAFQKKRISLGAQRLPNPHFGGGGGDGGDDDDDDSEEDPDEPIREPFKYNPKAFPHPNPLFKWDKKNRGWMYNLIHWVPDTTRSAMSTCIKIKREIDNAGNWIHSGAEVVHQATDTSSLTYKSSFNGDRYSTVVNRNRGMMQSPVMNFNYLTQNLFQVLSMSVWQHLSRDVVNVVPPIYSLLNKECQKQLVDQLNHINRLSMQDDSRYLYDGLVITGRPESAETLESNNWDHFLCKLWIAVNFVIDDPTFDLKLEKKMQLWYKNLPVMPTNSADLWNGYADWHLLFVNRTVDLMQSLKGLSFTSQTPIFIQHPKHNSKRGPFGVHNLFIEIMKKKHVDTIMTKFIAMAEFGGDVLYQNQKPVKAENVQDYLTCILIESELTATETAKTHKLLRLFDQQIKDNSDARKPKSLAMTPTSSGSVTRFTPEDVKSRNSSAQRKPDSGLKGNAPTTARRNMFARRAAAPDKLLYIDEQTLNAISRCDDGEYEYIDEENEPETLNKLLGLHDSPRAKSLQSFTGADRSTKGDKQKPVCLTLLHLGWCKYGDACSYNHDREALLAGREQAKKLWAEDIQLNHLSYHWTPVSTGDQPTAATDYTFEPGDEHEHALDTEEVPHSTWGSFIGDHDSE